MDPRDMSQEQFHMHQLEQTYRQMQDDEFAGRGIFAPPTASEGVPYGVPWSALEEEQRAWQEAMKTEEREREREQEQERRTAAEEAARDGNPEPPLLDDQEEAYDYLLGTLSSAQRDALLVLSLDSPADALDQLLTVLWGEFDREQRRRR
ncbi:hypothetical protein OG616_36880 [Streptomyces antibioticus]|uniref:hypothetical protein n=1 Tax=Streptomyces antibioticus TaxID=1890 RepID=UPI00224EE968|nr:hypothetical protein [Streptomyces antibioticus]MCX5173577.1 hypothetical protein [Streptomyces antibioticus]